MKLPVLAIGLCLAAVQAGALAQARADFTGTSRFNQSRRRRGNTVNETDVSATAA